ncbi:arylsulfatase-like [Clavelina lepadiformis]|uniref:arylsulfatase-like n=1 Tax=Clavelina lepadiformis TaxID=159417 RepID=UPI004041ADFA
MQFTKKSFAVFIPVTILAFVVAFVLVFTHHKYWNHSSYEPPNILFLLADDLGYGDLQSYGHPLQEAGGVERLVDEGMRFTQWYAPAMICTPSRVSTLTGRYSVRSGFLGDGPPVFIPSSPGGIPRNDSTIAETLRKSGYKTGMVGKWHLGTNKVNNTDGFFLPRHYGFDYVGTNMPFTNMETCNPNVYTAEEMGPDCFAYNDTTIAQQPVDLTTVTDKMLTEAKDFMTKNRNGKFFLFVSFIQTHVALFCGERHCGKSRRGLYGDNLNEMSDGISNLLDHLESLGLTKKTLVVFTSDNGPKMDSCPHGGDGGPFRGGKGATWEGGLRVPGVIRWPGVIDPGTVSTSVISTMDLYPTFVKLATGFKNQVLSEVDGEPIKEILCNFPEYKKDDKCTRSDPERNLFFYCTGDLFAVRHGDYKLHYKTKQSPMDRVVDDRHCLKPTTEELIRVYSCVEGVTTHEPPLLYNVVEDPRESMPLNISSYRKVVDIIDKLAKQHKMSIENVPEQFLPPNLDLIPCCNPPKCICTDAN